MIGHVPQTPESEFNEIVANSKETFNMWREVPTPQRVRYMMKYRQLLEQNQDDIAKEITREHGKSLVDAAGDVFRGYEVVEHAQSFNSLNMGETMGNVAKNVDI